MLIFPNAYMQYQTSESEQYDPEVTRNERIIDVFVWLLTAETNNTNVDKSD